MSLDVSMHAYERFCERVLFASPDDFDRAKKAVWLHYIAEQADCGRLRLAGQHTWRKHTKDATYLVKGLRVVSVLAPHQKTQGLINRPLEAA